MAQATILNLLTQSAHPSGNANMSLQGEKQKAAAYYLAKRDLQTVTWNFSSNFIGSCVIQASLVTEPVIADWFNVYSIDTESFKDGYFNLNGNFVWIRAVISNWTQGNIQLVTMSY
jgi:hypothetical protein